MSNWTLLKTPTGTQTRYLQQAARHLPAIPIYVPTYAKLMRSRKTRKCFTRTYPLYPGYIFARPDLSTGEHYLLLHLPTKARFIKFDNAISVIPNEIIEELKFLESKKLLTPMSPAGPRYRPGQKILVHFPTSDILATLIHVIADTRALVDTPIGRVTVPLPAIQAVAADM